MFGGFAFFFIMEKTLRTVSGEEDDGHGHGHTHGHTHVHKDDDPVPEAKSTAVKHNGDGLIQRSGSKDVKVPPPLTKETTAVHSTSKLSAYLNL